MNSSKIVNMMRKLYFISTLALLFMFGCLPQQSLASPERPDIVNWAKKIMEIESSYKETTDKYNVLQRKLGSRFPTDDEMKELSLIYETISGFYTELNKTTPPNEATSVHRKFKEYYELASNATLQYYISVQLNDITYYEKSVINSKEANRIGDEAFDDFIELLGNYSISCYEIGLCE